MHKCTKKRLSRITALVALTHLNIEIVQKKTLLEYEKLIN